MSTYREKHQPHRHDHRGVVHGQFHEEISHEELDLVREKLAKLQRQLTLQNTELVEAVVLEIESHCFQILSRPDDGTLPSEVVSLKAALQEAKDNYMR